MPLIHKSEFCCGFLGCGDVEVGGCYEDALAIFRMVAEYVYWYSRVTTVRSPHRQVTKWGSIS
jgi:hypothetical protein